MPFEMVRNDITRMNVDAIVNAANRSLLGGGGVDGAIHRAAGPELLEECRTLGGCETGEAKITKGYRLPARYVIHTVGPVWHGGTNGEKELLSACYRHSLELAAENGCESVAFPMISAGAYGYPKDQALAVAVDAITAFLLDHEMTVYLVIFGHDELITGKKLFRDIREYIDDIYAEKHFHANIEHSRRRRWQEDEESALQLDMEISKSIADQACYGAAPVPSAVPKEAASMPDWKELLKQTDEGFSQALLRLIDERGWTDAQCYKKANVDRKLFSKIRSNPDYRPSKPTALAFAVALELSMRETKELLKKAGFSLTKSSKFDLVLEYCINHKIYNIYEINEVLFRFDLPLLGSGMN
ncbi:MAG: O-acetyl-ADP-ribose deacetylase [Clostridia bacterium]|nr:O-acetyl-ADP-ribose deacetylase [Clostridia bacterium]